MAEARQNVPGRSGKAARTAQQAAPAQQQGAQTGQQTQQPPAQQQAKQTAQQQQPAQQLPARIPPIALAKVSAKGEYDIANWGLISASEDNGGSIAEAIEANLGGGELRVFDFERIKVPSGGGLAWTITDMETGQQMPAVEVIGIPIFFRDQKAFWELAFDDPNSIKGPPDCASNDTIVGFGDPGVAAQLTPDKQGFLCATCGNNRFNTAKGGTQRGKACRDVRMMFILREGDLLPILIPVPPTSLGVVRQFMMKLSSRGIIFHNAVCRFSLVSDKSSNGAPYSKVTMELLGTLSSQHRAVAKKFNASFRQMMGAPQLLIRPSDFNDEAEITNLTVKGNEPVQEQGVTENVNTENVNTDTGEVIETDDADASQTDAI